jgi:hypothetical protein
MLFTSICYMGMVYTGMAFFMVEFALVGARGEDRLGGISWENDITFVHDKSIDEIYYASIYLGARLNWKVMCTCNRLGHEEPGSFGAGLAWVGIASLLVLRRATLVALVCF